MPTKRKAQQAALRREAVKRLLKANYSGDSEVEEPPESEQDFDDIQCSSVPAAVTAFTSAADIFLTPAVGCDNLDSDQDFDDNQCSSVPAAVTAFTSAADIFLTPALGCDNLDSDQDFDGIQLSSVPAEVMASTAAADISVTPAAAGYDNVYSEDGSEWESFTGSTFLELLNLRIALDEEYPGESFTISYTTQFTEEPMFDLDGFPLLNAETNDQEPECSCSENDDTGRAFSPCQTSSPAKSCPSTQTNYENETKLSEQSPQIADATNVNKPKLKRSATRRACDTNQYFEATVPSWNDIKGRRIVDINYLLKCLVQAQANHSLSCRGLLCLLQEDYKSMVSLFWFKCNECEKLFKLRSEEPAPKPKLRRSAVWATLCCGSSYGQIKEFLAFCDIPFMPQTTFVSDEMQMDDVLEAAKDASLAKAIQEEKDAYLEELRINGTTMNDAEPVKAKVSLDGSWGTRSYGSRYTSVSGCGAIASERTKKIIFIATRNKRCSICSRQEQNKESPQKPHKCYRNYTGASGGMEPDIMIEGCQKLITQNLWITSITTDGDSTTVSKIKNTIKYGPSIEHQLCVNHICKNCGKKLREIKCPKEVKDLILKNVPRITLGIRSAIKHCAETSNGTDVHGLYNDIRNAPSHVFGDHTNCRDYFCSKDKKDVFHVERLIKCGAWSKIQTIVDGVAAKAESLKYNKTSNLAENIFARLCKYNMGKRVNLMSRGSYQRRVWITALQHNEGYSWHSNCLEEFAGCRPGRYLDDLVRERERLKIASDKSKQRPSYSRKSSKPVPTDKDYGESAVAETEGNIDIEEMKPIVLQSFVLTEASRQKLLSPMKSTEMEEYAKGRMLAKSAAEVVSSTAKTLPRKCEQILQTTTAWNFIKQNLSVVGTFLANYNQGAASKMGATKMFIDSCHNYLCCIPDAVSDDGSTIMVIRKKSCQGTIAELAAQNKLGLGLQVKNDQIILDTKTMNEMQIALHVTQASKVIFVCVNTENLSDYLLKEISPDAEHFAGKLHQKLETFFEDFLLKEIIMKGVDVKN